MRRETTCKIMRKLSKKTYCHGKNVYVYERFYIPVPKRFHERIKPFLDKRVRIEVKLENGALDIICRPCENSPTSKENRFCPTKYPPSKL